MTALLTVSYTGHRTTLYLQIIVDGITMLHDAKTPPNIFWGGANMDLILNYVFGLLF